MLALAELKAALQTLLQRYRFCPVAPTCGDRLVPPQVVLYMTLCPNHITMDVRRRHKG